MRLSGAMMGLSQKQSCSLYPDFIGQVWSPWALFLRRKEALLPDPPTTELSREQKNLNLASERELVGRGDNRTTPQLCTVPVPAD